MERENATKEVHHAQLPCHLNTALKTDIPWEMAQPQPFLKGKMLPRASSRTYSPVCSTSLPHREPEGSNELRICCGSAGNIGHNGHCKAFSLGDTSTGSVGHCQGSPGCGNAGPCRVLNTDLLAELLPAWPKMWGCSIPLLRNSQIPPEWYSSIAGMPLQMELDGAAHFKKPQMSWVFLFPEHLKVPFTLLKHWAYCAATTSFHLVV